MNFGSLVCKNIEYGETLLSKQLLPTEKNYLSAMGQLVERIDEKLSQIIAQITALGKIPILIGGGHN